MCENSIYNIPYTKKEHARNTELFEMVLYKAISKVKIRDKNLPNLIRISAEFISEEIEKGNNATNAIYSLIFDCVMFLNEDKRKDIIQNIISMYNDRNYDYGNIAEKQLMWDGKVSYKIMLEHKVSRFLNLLKEKNKSKDDSIEDTVKDIIGYSVIYLMWIIKGEQSINR